MSFAVAAVVDIVSSPFLFSSFCSTMPLPFNHININTRTADSHGPALVGYIETRAELNNVTS
jgi:hypothetical protein